jgi:hypothetical protein
MELQSRFQLWIFRKVTLNMADTASKLNDASAKAEKSAEEQLTALVGTDTFARLLSETMGTTMGLVKLWSDAFELGLKALRLPSQSELTRISRQVTRLEDKLEDILVAVERLEEQAERTANGSGPRSRVAKGS